MGWVERARTIVIPGLLLPVTGCPDTIPPEGEQGETGDRPLTVRSPAPGASDPQSEDCEGSERGKLGRRGGDRMYLPIGIGTLIVIIVLIALLT